MTKIEMPPMDRLLCPIEQAKKYGIIKESKQLIQPNKQNHILLGFIIACSFLVFATIIANSFHKKDDEE